MSNTSDIIDDFKVQYKRGTTLDVTESQHEAIQHQAMLGQTSVSPSTVELAQLQILHRARKRKLEELTNELASKEKDYERKLRVLNHQLALVKGAVVKLLMTCAMFFTAGSVLTLGLG